MPSDTLRSLTHCSSNSNSFMLCIVVVLLSYLLYCNGFFPTRSLHTLPFISLFFFHSLTRVPQAGLVGGFRKDCRYSSSLLLFYGIFSFFLALVTVPRIIIRYPCFALKKNLPLEVAPFILFFLVEKQDRKSVV